MKINPEELQHRDRYALMISTIIPRPIAFVSTVSRDGALNAAPFSYFSGVTSTPPIISIAISKRGDVSKDSARNILETGEFVVNIVSKSLAKKMNIASGDYPPDVNEFEVAGLEAVPSDIVKPPRIGGSPISMECRLYQAIDIAEARVNLILGRVVLFHIAEDILVNGKVSAERVNPIARLGGSRYTKLGEIFEMPRPTIDFTGS